MNAFKQYVYVVLIIVVLIIVLWLCEVNPSSGFNSSSILKFDNIGLKGLVAEKKTLIKKPNTRTQTVKNNGYKYLLQEDHWRPPRQ